jgi:hypothetical protein
MDIVKAVYNVVAPVGAPYPHLIYHSLGGPDDYTLTRRIRTSYQYDVRIVDKSESAYRINAAVKRVDALLNDNELVSGDTLYCRRVGVIPNHPEQDEDGRNTNARRRYL